MKIYLYELYKLLSRRLFWALLAGALAVCAFLYLNGQGQGLDRESSYAVEAHAENLNGLPIEECTTQIENGLVTASIRSAILSAQDSVFGDIFLELYREQYPEQFARIEAEGVTQDGEALRQQILLWTELKRENDSIVSYPAFIAAVQANAAQMSESSLFGKPGTFSYANAEQTAADYEGLENMELRLGLSAGVTTVSSFLPGELLMLLFVLTVCILAFFDEYRKGMLSILHSCTHGRGSLIGGKLAAVTTVCLFGGVLYAVLMLLLGAYRYGYGDLTRTIQSLPEFRDCTLALSVDQYMTLAFAIKTSVFVGAGLYFCAVFTMFKENVGTVMLVSLLPLAVFFILSKVLRPSFILNHFKYINPFFWLDGTALYGQYINLNFFSMPVRALSILPVAQGLLCMLSITFACVRFIHDRAAHRTPLTERAAAALSTRLRRRDKTVSLFKNEGYKLMFQEKLLVILLIVLTLSLYMASGYHTMTFNENDALYRQYLLTLSGEASEEAWAQYRELAEEYETLDQQIEELRQQRADGKITGLEMQVQIDILENTIGRREKAFSLVRQDAEYVQGLQESGRSAWFVDQISGKVFMDSSGVELKNAVLFFAAAVLCASALYGAELRRDLLGLFCATSRGRGAMAVRKFLWLALLVMVIYISVYVPYWVYLVHNLGTLPWRANLYTLQEYVNYQGSLTIGRALLLRAVCTFIVGLAGAMVTVALSLKLKNRIAALVLGLALLCVPVCLQWAGVELRNYTSAGAPMLCDTLKTPGALMGGRALLFASVLLTAISVIVILCHIGALRRRKSA